MVSLSDIHGAGCFGGDSTKDTASANLLQALWSPVSGVLARSSRLQVAPHAITHLSWCNSTKATSCMKPHQNHAFGVRTRPIKSTNFCTLHHYRAYSRIRWGGFSKNYCVSHVRTPPHDTKTPIPCTCSNTCWEREYVDVGLVLVVCKLLT